jgi:hypothetical protein
MYIISQEDLERKIITYLGNIGRMISSSKGRYRHYNPNNIVYFNANIFVPPYGKVWYGDIDITEDFEKLQKIVEGLENVKLFILPEMAGRFDNKEKEPELDRTALILEQHGFKFGADEHLIEQKEDKEDGKLKYYYKQIELVKQTELPERNNGDYKKDDFFIKCKINMKLLSEYKKNDILDLLYSGVMEALKTKGIPIAEHDHFSLYCSKETNKNISEIVKKWLIKEYNLKEDGYELKKELMWLSLSLPIDFYGSKKGPDWVEEDTIYIKRK